MLTKRELATVLAALLYWQEEICPHGQSAARPYFERLRISDVRPLSPTQIVRLSRRLRAKFDRA